MNGNLVTVTLSDAAPADIKASDIVFSNGVTAEKVTVSGKTLQITTSNLPANTTLTVSFKNVAELEGKSGSFSFNQAVVLESSIEGFVNLATYTAAGAFDGYEAEEGVTVTAGGVTTKTDENGYYKLAVQPGLVEVNVKVAGFYDHQVDVTVTDKNSTAHVIDLDAINVNELKIEGIAKDATTGAAITGATVVLEQKVNGAWKEVAEATSSATGEYAFLNSTATTTATGTAAYQFTDIFGDRTNVIATGSEYRIVATKDVLGDVYHEVTSNVTVSTKAPRTYAPVSLTPVKEIANLDLSYTFNPNVLEANTVDTSANKVAAVGLTLIDANGKAVKHTVATAQDLAVEKDAVTGIYSGKINLVDVLKSTASVTKVQIKSGDYFLKVDDGKNAIQIIAFKVVEGTNGTYSIEAKAPQNLTVSSAFTNFPSDTTNAVDGILRGTTEAQVWQTVNGKDVLVDTKAVDYEFTSGTPNKLDDTVTVARLAAQGYKVTLDGKYVLGTPAQAVNVVANNTSQANIPVSGAGLFEATLDLKDADGNEIALQPKTSHAIKAIVKDEAGKTVGTHDLTFVIKTDGTLLQTDVTGVTVAKTGTTTNDLVVTVPKLTPGKYTVEFSSDNFKATKTTLEQVKMFGTATDTKDFIATPTVVVAGSLTFADLTDATASKVLIYDLNGKTPTKLSATALTAANVVATLNPGAYKIDLGSLAAGKYKLVFYGANFETVEKEVTVAKGLNTNNVTVTKGGQAQVDLNVFDSNGIRLASTDVTLTATDAYGETIAFGGALTAGKVSTTATASKGAIKFTFTDAAGTNTVYKTHSETVTVDRINGTFLKTVEVPLVNNGKTFDVSGSITVANASTDVDLRDGSVIIKDAATGKFVKTAPISASAAGGNGTFTTKLANGSYVISVFENGSYVPVQTIQVKDREVTNVNFVVTNASR